MSSAEALFLVLANALELVVERQLRAGLDVLDGEESDPCVAVDAPLLRDAVGVAGVVHKPLKKENVFLK